VVQAGSTDQIASLWKQRLTDPEPTLDLLEAVLGSAELSPSDLVRALVCKAACLAALYRLDEITSVTERAQALLAELEQPFPEVESELHRCNATVAFYTEDDAEAMRLSIRSLELASTAGDRELVALAHSNIAAVFGKAGEYRSALRHLQHSLHLTPESETSNYGVLLNNLGNIYLHLERTDEALVCFEQARRVFRKRQSSLMASIALSNSGRSYEKLRLYDKALESLEQALQEFREGEFTTYIPAANSKLGNVWAAMGKPLQAEAHYLEAIAHYDRGLEGGFEPEARQLYAEFLLRQDRVSEAIEQLEAADSICRERQVLEGRISALQLLATAYEQSGETARALSAMKEFISLKDEHADNLARAAIPAEVGSAGPLPETEHELVELTTAALLTANRQLALDSRKLEQLALTDHLTGLRNRHYLAEALGHAFTGHRAGDRAFSLIMLDIDQFKLVNDVHGHATGDLVLQELARILTGSVRGTDVVARWGGEEFIIFLAQAPLAVAARVAEKLRIGVQDHDWSRIAPDLGVTISLGVVSAGEHPELDLDGLIARVDSLLLEAKGQGRNRVLMVGNPTAAAEAL
jgi:diguanylate cyclase (GGDEF)-like protein